MSIALPAFLDAQVITQNGLEAGLDESTMRTLHALARRIADDPELVHEASATHHGLFDTNEDVSEAVRETDRRFGANADVLHALFVLDSLRLTRERQAGRGMPEPIARAVNARFGGAWLREAAAQGEIGRTYWNPHWLRIAASGHLVRLGRLEFLPLSWNYPFRVYVNERTGEVVALADNGLRFTDEGLLVGETTWEATLTETDDTIIGTPITLYGVALPHQVRLPRREWRLTVSAGDPVLDMHVPSEGALTLGALRDALEQAVPFFEHFYPDHRFVAYVCDSWLFSPQLETMLGTASNIVRWQHEGYMLPSNNDAGDVLAFTFGSSTIDTATAARDTRLRRSLLSHLEQGNVLCCGRYVLLRSDLERFGDQPYRESSMQTIERVTIHS